MIEIKDYTAEFEEDLQNLDTDMYMRIKSELGYVTESACVALMDEEFVGAGMLKYNSESFIDLNFKTVFGLEADIEVAISEALIEDLMLTYQISVLGVEGEEDDKLEEDEDSDDEESDDEESDNEELDNDGQDDDFEEEPQLLRTWCDVNSEEYRELLEDIGYYANRTLIRMTYLTGITESIEGMQPLKLTFTTEDEDPIVDDVAVLAEEMDAQISECRLVILRADNMDDEMAGHYMIAEATAFEELPDESDFSYRMNKDGAEIWTIMCEEGIVAAVTVEKDPDDINAVELGHVFCDEDFRGKKLAGKLLKTVIGNLEQKGIGRFALSVFSDNPNAIGLYRKLGFKTGNKLIEMIYRG